MYENDPVRIFVVEDDPAYTKFLMYVLSLNPDFEPEFFTSGKDCLAHLHKKPSVITLDYSLPDMEGEKVLKSIREFDPNISVIIVSAQEKIGTAVENAAAEIERFFEDGEVHEYSKESDSWVYSEDELS